MEYDLEFDYITVSPNSVISDDEFYDVRQGNYHKFDTFDDDIDIIKSDLLHDQFNISNREHIKYDSGDDVIIINPETVSHSLEICTDDKIDINQNSEFAYVVKSGEIPDSEPSISEKKLGPLFVLRTHLRAKRSNFLNMLKNDKCSSIFPKLLCRTQSVPKIVIDQPDHDFDNGYESYNDLKVLIDSFDEESSNKKLYVASKKKAMRKSI